MAQNEVYRSALTESNMMQASTVSAVAGNFIKLGEYKVEAGQLISIGYGEQSGLDSAQGRIYLALNDSASAAIHGKIRLAVHSPQGRPMMILAEYRTETLRDNPNDRTKQTPFPENQYWLSEDKKLVLEFEADSTKTVDKSKSDILFDVTQAVV